MVRHVGEETAEAFHQPHPFREFYISSGTGCVGQCHAEYVVPSRKMGGQTDKRQTNTLKDTQEQDTMEAMSTLTSQKDCVRREHFKPLA